MLRFGFKIRPNAIKTMMGFESPKLCTTKLGIGIKGEVHNNPTLILVKSKSYRAHTGGSAMKNES